MRPSLRTIPIPYVTNLEQVYEEFNESFSLFATFIEIKYTNEIVNSVCIPWVRFREYDEHSIVARNCDCDGEICGTPTTKYVIPKNKMKDYVFYNKPNNLHYVFIRLV